MKYTYLFAVLFSLIVINPIHAQENDEVLAAFIKIGLIDVVVEADFDERSVMQIEAITDKARKIAKKLNKLVKKDGVIKRVELCERGRDGTPVVVPGYDEEGSDPTKIISLYIGLPESLFEEDMIFKLYRYGITIPQKLYFKHGGRTLLEMSGLLPPPTDCSSQ